MDNRKRLAACACSMLVLSTLASQSAIAGENAVSIDMTNLNNEAWSGIAMANDDTVMTGVNIRSTADEDSKVVGFLYRGGAVCVVDRGEEWTEVSSGNITGYIKNEYLTYGTDAKGLAEHYGEYGAKASWDDVKLFADSNGDASIIQTASDGQIFRLVGQDGDWMQLKAGTENNAYVPAEDVDLVIVLDGAVSVQEEECSQEVFTAVAGYEESAGSDAGSSDTSADYEEAEVYENTAQNYAETGSSADAAASYEETTVYEEPAVTYEETTSSAETAASADTSASAADYSYTATYDGSGSLQEQANALYNDYLNAQAAADAAVNNGAGEETIISTAKAAQEAYATFLSKQNEADAAAYGTASTTAATSTSGTAAGTSAESSAAFANTADTAVTQTTAADTTSQDTTAAQTETYVEETTVTETEATSRASSSDLELLAALIYCEAGNQPYEGQVAVGAVVMNRIASGSFPNTITEVINQSGQFTPSYSGALASALANGSGANYIGAASDAMAGSDPTGGALYFNTHQGTGVKIGAHWFF